MILFLFLIQLVRSRCGVLLHVVQLRPALLRNDSWGAKMVKPSSQYLNDAYSENTVKRKECHTALMELGLTYTSVFILRFAIELLCKCCASVCQCMYCLKKKKKRSNFIYQSHCKFSSTLL